MIEIERKFLIDSDKIPSITVHEYEHIIQAYPDWDFGNVIYRLRAIRHCLVENDKLQKIEYVQGIKGKSSDARLENEIELSISQFKALSPLCKYAIEKQRYKLLTKDKKYIIDLDYYLNELSGLIVAEVEFKTIEQRDAYVPESWFGLDVTKDDRYSNYTLAKDGKTF